MSEPLSSEIKEVWDEYHLPPFAFRDSFSVRASQLGIGVIKAKEVAREAARWFPNTDLSPDISRQVSQYLINHSLQGVETIAPSGGVL